MDIAVRITFNVRVTFLLHHGAATSCLPKGWRCWRLTRPVVMKGQELVGHYRSPKACGTQGDSNMKGLQLVHFYRNQGFSEFKARTAKPKNSTCLSFLLTSDRSERCSKRRTTARVESVSRCYKWQKGSAGMMRRTGLLKLTRPQADDVEDGQWIYVSKFRHLHTFNRCLRMFQDPGVNKLSRSSIR